MTEAMILLGMFFMIAIGLPIAVSIIARQEAAQRLERSFVANVGRQRTAIPILLSVSPSLVLLLVRRRRRLLRSKIKLVPM